MMALRRAALDEMAEVAGWSPESAPFSRIRVELADHLTGEADVVPEALVEAVSERLPRDPECAGPGAALVRGLTAHFDLDRARRFHEALFRKVWEDLRRRSGELGRRADHRIKVKTTSDGNIPVERYGSDWSFKRLHMDREVLLFSHLYGPLAGFTGGSVHLVDVRAYMCRNALRFADVFQWSDEPSQGSKPVLRAEHCASALATCGVDLGVIGPDEVLFVNNAPGAGILHGVTPVVVSDRARFVREFHRCSVKALEPAEHPAPVQ